jgi:superfamily II DNA/RNA helicase
MAIRSLLLIGGTSTERRIDKQLRKQALDGFRSGAIRVLIASDVAARALDIKGVTLVVNLGVSTLSKACLHRTGRTGRAGTKRLDGSFVTASEVRVIRRHQQELGIARRCVRLREGRRFPADVVVQTRWREPDRDVGRRAPMPASSS